MRAHSLSLVVVVTTLGLVACERGVATAPDLERTLAPRHVVAAASIADEINHIFDTLVSDQPQDAKTAAAAKLGELIRAASGAELAKLQDALIKELLDRLGSNSNDARGTVTQQLKLYIRSLTTAANAKEIETLTAAVRHLTTSTDNEVKLRAESLLKLLTPGTTLTGVEKTCPNKTKATVRFTLEGGGAFSIVIKIDGAKKTTLRNQPDGTNFHQEYEELEPKQEHTITIEIKETENSITQVIDPPVTCPS